MAFMNNIRNYGNGITGISALLDAFASGAATITGGNSEYELTPEARQFITEQIAAGNEFGIELDLAKLGAKGSFSLGAYRADGTFGDYVGLPSINIPAVIGGHKTPANIDGQTLIALLQSDTNTTTVTAVHPLDKTDNTKYVLDRKQRKVINLNFAGSPVRFDKADTEGKAKYFASLVKKFEIVKTKVESLVVNPV